jgi:ABC-type hemin transport system ATPase subunit
MLELAAGTRQVRHAGLRYVLEEPLELPPGCFLHLTGENGAGKTTFLEHVLIPELRENHRLLYLAQDMELQRNTMRATLALLGQTAPAGLADLALAWVEASGCREAIVLDEFDKHLTPDQLRALNLPRFTWAVVVSHLSGAGAAARTGFAHGRELRFTRPRSDGPDVILEAITLWPA